MGVSSHLNCCKPLFESVSVEFDDKQKQKKKIENISLSNWPLLSPILEHF